eukprot:COSAG06_NODE_25886_length_626_cov_1.958254_2_plen_20_part_01
MSTAANHDESALARDQTDGT